MCIRDARRLTEQAREEIRGRKPQRKAVGDPPPLKREPLIAPGKNRHQEQ